LKHAERVLEILQLKNPTESEGNDISEDRLEFEDQIEGVVYCDYTSPKFESKPDPEFYRKVCIISAVVKLSMLIIMPTQALIQANVTDPSRCLFVDDSRINVEAAKKEGWGRCVHFYEPELQSAGDSEQDEGAMEHDVVVISNLEQLRDLWPDIFKKAV